MGRDGSLFQILRHLAALHQHQYDDRHILDGFLIQNTQNRETRIVTLKLDELLRGVEGARTGLVKLDHMPDEELEIVQQEFTHCATSTLR